MTARSAYGLWLESNIKSGELLQFDSAQAPSRRSMARSWTPCRLAAGPDRSAEGAPGSRILDGQFTAVQQAIGTPKKNTAGFALLKEFVEEAKRSGIVASFIERHGVVGRLSVAGHPACCHTRRPARGGVPEMPDDMSSTPTELAFLTIAEAARLIEKKQLSPVELTTALIRRAEALDSQLNAYLLPTFDRAIEQARAAEREIMAGRYRGPMHGIPFGLKDIYATAGIRTTGHSGVCIDTVPDRRRDDGAKALRRRGHSDRQARDP